MSILRDKFFWATYGRFALAVVLGFGAAFFVLGVPGDVTVELAAGAILTFPAAYTFSTRQHA